MPDWEEDWELRDTAHVPDELTGARYRWPRYEGEADTGALYEQLANEYERIDRDNTVVLGDRSWILVEPQRTLIRLYDDDYNTLAEDSLSILEEEYPHTTSQTSADWRQQYAPDDTLVSPVGAVISPLEEFDLTVTGPERATFHVQAHKVAATVSPRTVTIRSDPDRDQTDADEALLSTIHESYPHDYESRLQESNGGNFRQRIRDLLQPL